MDEHTRQLLFVRSTEVLLLVVGNIHREEQVVICSVVPVKHHNKILSV